MPQEHRLLKMIPDNVTYDAIDQSIGSFERYMQPKGQTANQ